MLTQTKTPRPAYGRLHWGYENLEEPLGLVGPPTGYASAAERHMLDYGTTSAQLGAIAITRRQHALPNDNARMRPQLTLENYLQSPCLPVRFDEDSRALL